MKGMTFFALISAFTTTAWAAPMAPQKSEAWEEIPVDHVFIPETGYDDNDNVGLVTDGSLPNGCYTIGPVVIDREPGSKTIAVRQMAHRDRTGYCEINATIPAVMKRPVPFTAEGVIGQLGVGDYTIKYRRPRGAELERKFGVAPALTRNVDSLPYALVTGIELADYIRTGEDLSPVLIGILTSTCADINTDVQVLYEGDVFVALPTQRINEGDRAKASPLCADVIRPFRLPLQLGKLSVGRYLLHVRSMNGGAVNKIFGVF